MYLGEESLHLCHSFAQLLLCVFGSLQCIVSYCYSTVTVQASTVAVSLIISATCTPTRTFSTGSITRGTTDLLGQVDMCLYLFGYYENYCVYL